MRASPGPAQVVGILTYFQSHCVRAPVCVCVCAVCAIFVQQLRVCAVQFRGALRACVYGINGFCRHDATMSLAFSPLHFSGAQECKPVRGKADEKEEKKNQIIHVSWLWASGVGRRRRRIVMENDINSFGIPSHVRPESPPFVSSLGGRYGIGSLSVVGIAALTGTFGGWRARCGDAPAVRDDAMPHVVGSICMRNRDRCSLI